jgi:hypothetical protein
VDFRFAHSITPSIAIRPAKAHGEQCRFPLVFNLADFLTGATAPARSTPESLPGHCSHQNVQDRTSAIAVEGEFTSRLRHNFSWPPMAALSLPDKFCPSIQAWRRTRP